MVIPHSESFGRRCGNFDRFPKRVKGYLELFLVEIAIHHDSTFPSGACHGIRCYAFDDGVNI